MSGRVLSEDEKRAWRAVTRHVRPMSGRRTALHPSVRGSSTEDTPFRPGSHAPRTVSQKQPSAPQNRRNEKPVRRGKQMISASFDLHGHSQDSAWRALPLFLSREQAKGARCVIVITGKGKLGEGVLRRNFLHWLEMPEARGLVSGYAPAHAKHGGGGAWYIFLRKR